MNELTSIEVTADMTLPGGGLALGLGGISAPVMDPGEVCSLLVKGLPGDSFLSGLPDEARQIQDIGSGNWILVSATLSEIVFHPGDTDLPVELQASFVITSPEGSSRLDPRDIRILVEATNTHVQAIRDPVEHLPEPPVSGIDFAAGWGVARPDDPQDQSFDAAHSLTADEDLDGPGLARGWGVTRSAGPVMDPVPGDNLALGWGVNRDKDLGETQNQNHTQDPASHAPVDGTLLAAGWGIVRSETEAFPAVDPQHVGPADVDPDMLARGWGVDRAKPVTSNDDVPLEETAADTFDHHPDISGQDLALGWGVDRSAPPCEAEDDTEAALAGDELALGWGVDRHATVQIDGFSLAKGWGVLRGDAPDIDLPVAGHLDSAPDTEPETEPTGPEPVLAPEPQITENLPEPFAGEGPVFLETPPVEEITEAPAADAITGTAADPDEDGPAEPPVAAVEKRLPTDDFPVFASPPARKKVEDTDGAVVAVRDDDWEGVMVTQGRPDAMAMTVMGKRWYIVLDDGQNAFKPSGTPQESPEPEIQLFDPQKTGPWQLY